MSNNKQSSVEWLHVEFQKRFPKETAEMYNNNQLLYEQIIEQAKAMHKEEIINIVVWCDDTDRKPQQIKIEAEQYYNETFGGNK